MKSIITMFALLCIGCESAATPAQHSQYAPQAWSVSITYSGGIAGSRIKTVVRHDGLIIRETGKNQIVSSRADRDKLVRLENLIQRFSDESVKKKSMQGITGVMGLCRDCTYTTITLSRNDRETYQGRFASKKEIPAEISRIIQLVGELSGVGN